ncbi:MAG TPA: B12-binding domain-containing radical SAM protein [Verrucomicrobia bacterium]|nr:MAG: hypothetical protein A2X46_17490 [Lentisphaerae bacterium GWF2_57_35]HBA85866.1 B12-binding domain-containing radical SAM protein [Verrucomicrobiota bacterium]
MADIVLTTLNARYGHTAFGLRYLQANLGELAERSVIMEFDLQKSPQEMASHIASVNPAIVGIGVYIWNSRLIADLIRQLRAQMAKALIVLGGPEVSYEISPELLELSDVVISGEADLEFAKLCRRRLGGRSLQEKTLHSQPPEPCDLALPYELYTDQDLAHRTLYVETSRGCPFSCEYCLSSVERSVRFFPLQPLLSSFKKLLDRGARHFKFADRTFNLNLPHCMEVLRFFLREYRPGLFLHCEMIPDRFPAELRALIQAFPPETLQFEIGIQTWNPEVARRIQRIQDNALIAENLHFLRQETGVYLHADLIAGLPGESLDSFAEGFDRLAALQPHEIQVGLLKRLRGTAIGRHDKEWAMHYQTTPPYGLLSNKLLTEGEMDKIRRFAHYWDSIYNSGNFVGAASLLWQEGSPFQRFMYFSEALYAEFQREHGIALDDLAAALYRHLTVASPHSPEIIGSRMARDYFHSGRPRPPSFLKEYANNMLHHTPTPSRPGLQRQARHFAAARLEK